MQARPVSADQAYQVFKNDSSIRLTEEQVAAVENASTTGTTLVVAGAGSGKTELMATRVVWLVANGICAPEQILGLTFTRKAASELSKRINNALSDLAKTELWPFEDKAFAAPNITTYNSYANSLYRDYALALGYEDDATLLTEASRYQLAREVVVKYGEMVDARLIDSDIALSRVVTHVLNLAGAMNDHGVTAEEIEAHIKGFYESMVKLPPSAKTKTSPEQPIAAGLLDLFSGSLETPMLANLAQAFIEEKRRRGYIDYSDQVALAERAVRELGDTVVARETTQYTQILLDEFQDTSTLQTRLLAGIFAGKSVLAVGDPNQSIYGWRGASASNLADFLQMFGIAGQAVPQLTLTTSWRNPKVVLDLANRILGPLNVPAKFLAGRPPLPKVNVQPLRPSGFARDGQITIKFADEVSNEAKFAATWLLERMVANPEGELPTAAVLMRSRNMMAVFEHELREAGLNVEVVGLGGLLEAPEIVDLVAALRVIHYPDAGAYLMRLLAGPRWQVQPKDLQRLNRYARKVAEFYTRSSNKIAGAEAEASIIDALDYLLDEEDKDRIPDFSEQGLAALRNCAGFLRELRKQTGMPLPEFVRAVEQELWLDIELTANPNRLEPLANLNAFSNVVSGYAESGNSTLGGFLEWLEYAASQERFETPAVHGRRGVVQIITAHTSKGLEWDYVVVPRLVETTFPSIQYQTDSGWMSAGKMPFALRGDANSLPTVDLSNCSEQNDAKKLLTEFQRVDQIEYLMREERRLAYVAFTRPKKELLLSGSLWKPGVKGKSTPSPFLLEAATMADPRITVIDHTGDFENPLPTYSELETNPTDLSQITEQWPMEPLGLNHRPKVMAAKEAVEGAIASAPSRTKWDEQIDRLIEERALLLERSTQVKLPVRIPASRFKEFVYELPKLAEKYRRPMPEQPYKQTMAGTLFHAWVEQRFGVLSNSDELDAIEVINEDEATSKTVEQLRTIFENSRFANMKPFAIEGEIQVTIKGNTFICKLDAVFETETGYEIVDWKTGKPPVGDKEIADRALQLALYRMAFARLYKVDPSKIEVCLYYVAEDLEIKPEVVPSEADLISLWDSVLENVVD
jgi:DNA helicase-2/ATP-dependent DNA helicase PcrA